jgi:CHAP domain
VSIASVHARIAELNSLFAPRPVAPTPTTAANSASFAGQLQSATGATATAAGAGVAPAGGATSAGQAMLNLVKQEVGVKEQPPGSNDAPRIAQYRKATAGSGVGPWCAYFVSWAAREAGVPIGDNGQGFGRVDDVYAWAQKAGKAIPAGDGVKPQPGDLIVWDEHIGIVESVDSDGTIHTVEGNSSDQVAQRTYGADGGGAIGYVRLG